MLWDNTQATFTCCVIVELQRFSRVVKLTTLLIQHTHTERVKEMGSEWTHTKGTFSLILFELDCSGAVLPCGVHVACYDSVYEYNGNYGGPH